MPTDQEKKESKPPFYAVKFFICLSIPHLSLMMHKVLSFPFLILYPSLSFILCDVHRLLCYKLFKDIVTLYIYMHWNNLCNLWSKTCYIWLHSFSLFTLPSQPFLFMLIFATLLCFQSHQIRKSIPSHISRRVGDLTTVRCSTDRGSQ